MKDYITESVFGKRKRHRIAQFLLNSNLPHSIISSLDKSLIPE